MPPQSRARAKETLVTAVPDTPHRSNGLSLAVLHTVFALTGVIHAIGGSLLPSLASFFQLSDSQSGSLLTTYFAATSLGALLTRGPRKRLMAIGFLVVAVASIGIVTANPALLYPLFFALGIGCGIPMTAVSMYAGQRFGAHSAAPLTFLNFSWSAGALIAPLFASRLLLQHDFRAAYSLLACSAFAAAVACWTLLQELPPSTKPLIEDKLSAPQRSWIALFAFLTFIQVGIEDTTSTWLATYSMRGSGTAPAAGAASSSLYWTGFLASRGLSSLVLLRMQPMHLLRAMVCAALAASALLVGLTSTSGRATAMLVLGAALAPIFPLLLARFFARARRSSDSRWVLAICGFGGSVVPWLTGFISTQSHSLRLGLLIVPAALLVILALLPAIATPQSDSPPLT